MGRKYVSVIAVDAVLQYSNRHRLL